MDRPRYVQQVVRGGVKRWRYNPPPNAINAGIVKRTYLPARKETAFNVAERYNARVDAWREELCSALPVATVNGMIEIYKQSLSYQRLNVLSQTTYTYQLNLLCEMECRGTQLGAYKYDKVTAPMAQKLYEQLCQRGIPFANRVMSAIRRVYSHAIQFGTVDKNPWKGVETYAESHRRQVWTATQVKTFLTYCYSDFSSRSVGLIVHMAYEWAQRVGDMRKLTWESIDLENATLTLTQSKRGAQVKIPIQEDLLNILRDQYNDFGWQKYVAPNVSSINSKSGNGFQPYTVYALSHAARRMLNHAGMPTELRISDLRRTATIEMCEAGVEMAQLMSVTGHANPQSVKPYMKNTLLSAKNACKLRNAHRQEVHIKEELV
tara:strand:+ start:45 stop:1175 length:1131 start_codon:yes stop_codon:yes gene_type:complete